MPARILMRIVRVGVIVYIAICGLLFLGQRWLVFPGASAQGKPESHIDFGSRGTVIHLTTADGVPVAAVFGPAGSSPTTRPTILYFYGNGSSAAYSQGEFDHFRSFGCNVLIPDYVGFGESGGKPGESGCYQTADAAYDWLVNRQHVDPKQIVVVGWSLGGAVAIDLASRRPVGGLAVFNAFTTMPEVAGHMIPWVPGRWMLVYRFDNLSKIALVKCPVLICNGLQDQLVDPAMGDRLAAAAAGDVTRFTVPGADHNTIFSVEPAKVFGRLQEFVRHATAGKR